MYLDKKEKQFSIEGVPQETLPTLSEGYFDDRTDPRWAHPELTAIYEVEHACDQSAKVSAPEITEEERLQRKAEWLKPTLERSFPKKHDVVRTEYTVKGLNEKDPDITVYVTKKRDSQKEISPVLFGIGQGAMMFNPYKGLAPSMELIAMEHDVTLVFAEARTAVEAPFPAALDDYQAVYQWMLDNAKELKIDSDNVVLLGESGGGYTSLCFAFRCKRVGFKPRGCMAREPITDDSMSFPSSRIVQGGWDAADNHRIFQILFGKNNAYSPFLTPEHVPNHATVEDCKGLCPIFIHAMELDADRDASMDFARKLYEAKVYTQIHVWGGAGHGAFFLPPKGESKIHDAYKAICFAELHDMFTYDLRRLWLND